MIRELLPRRFTLRNHVQVFPVAIEIRLPAVGQRPMTAGATNRSPGGALKHGGLLIAPARLGEFFPTIPGRSATASRTLRRELVRVLDSPSSPALSQILDTVLEDLLGLSSLEWLKGPSVGEDWARPALSGEIIKPRRVWHGPHGSALPVFVARGSLGTGRRELVSRIGVGRGRRSVSRVVAWLRQVDCPLAVLTNGRQWRLIHAGAEYDAWCEWDTDLWFEGGCPGPQITALRALLGRDSLVSPSDDEPCALTAAILDSRRGQAELSSALGERVRQAVEALIDAFGPALDAIDGELADNADGAAGAAGYAGATGDVPRTAIYTAATRMVMRCVVVLFAEARGDELLPRSNPVYIDSYSLSGLREDLDRLAGGRASERLRHSHGAWPRLLSLFSLVHDGSPHPDLAVLAYGGALFRPGDPASSDPILRAMAVFEDAAHGPSDAVVHRVLTLLTRSRVKVRRGRGATWVETPVDFSDLSTQYIGILYEGLLDFELRHAPADDAIVFVNIGDQPALPLSRLEGMSDEELPSCWTSSSHRRQTRRRRRRRMTSPMPARRPWTRRAPPSPTESGTAKTRPPLARRDRLAQMRSRILSMRCRRPMTSRKRATAAFSLGRNDRCSPRS